MLRRTMQVLLTIVMIASVAKAGSDPFVGDWRLDTSKSKATDEMRVASVGENKYVFDLGGGIPETITIDGTDQSGLGGTTLAVEAENAETWKVVRKRDGKMLLIGIWSLSADGTVLTDDYTSFDATGMPHNTKYHYARTAGGPGFVATWVNDTLMNTSYVIGVKSVGDNGLSFARADVQSAMKLEFDGKDHPPINANAAAGSASSARRVDERALEITDKLKGATIATEQLEISADLKTLTWTKLVVGRTRPNTTLVFERQ
jgi:hypothetical protein